MQQLRYEQACSRPAGATKPKSREAMTGFTFTEYENKCLKIRLQLSLGRELPPKQQKVVRKIGKLSQEFPSPPLNGLRHLFAHLVLDPTALRQEKLQTWDPSAYKMHPGQEVSKSWNKMVALLYGLLEIGNYDFQDSQIQIVKEKTHELDIFLSNFPDPAIRDATKLQDTKKSLALLKQCVEDFETLFPILLTPSSGEQSLWVSPRTNSGFKKNR